MLYLIDGYNLLYALGRLSPRSGNPALRASRSWLLIELARWHAPEAPNVTVVFDGGNAPGGIRGETERAGIRVLFSRGQTADDLIEDLIRDEANPRRLTVVSDDHRLRDAAKRRSCPVLGCLDYASSWQEARPAAVSAAPPEAGKPESISDEEKREWLEVFRIQSEE